MIVDGRAIAADIYARIAERTTQAGISPRLAVLTCAPNAATRQYLDLKARKAADVGIVMVVTELKEESTTEEVIATITDLAPQAEAIIVQLPLPPHIDTERVLAAIPSSHDADALNIQTTNVLSPVVAACKEILGRHAVPVFGAQVAIVGSGRLVGQPAAHWFESQGAAMSIVTKDTAELSYYTKTADIIVLGAGHANLLTPDMIKEGVVILDAGTSEDGGELRGDADPRCSEKALLFTPVPGGIGPITVAALLANVVTLVLDR